MALKAINYQGYLVVESFTSEPPPDFSMAVCSWRPFAPDMDELAKEGLAFVQRLVA